MMAILLTGENAKFFPQFQRDAAPTNGLCAPEHLKYYYAAHQSSERLLRITAASMYRDYMIAVG